MMMSPTVEPFIVFGYVTFYFAPYFPANWIAAQATGQAAREAFVSRHPLISLARLILVIGFIFDTMLEVSLVRTGHVHLLAGRSRSARSSPAHLQFPLLWESLRVTFVMVPAGILVYRDDTGKSVAEKLADKARLFPTKPALGTFLMMFVIINIGVLRLRRVVPGDQGQWIGDIGRMPVAVPGGESV